MRRGRCLAGLTTSLAVLRWRPVVVSWLTNSDSKSWCYCFKQRRERLLLFPSPPFPFLSFCFSVVSLYPPGLFLNFLPCFKLFLPLTIFWFLSFYSLHPFPFGSFFPFFGSFSSPVTGVKSSIYWVKGAGAPLSPPYRFIWGATPSCPATVLV